MRAAFQINVAGVNVSQRFDQFLEQLSVNDKVGTTSDTASITLDDSSGRIAMPQIGEPITILLGWEESGVSLVFDGTVDSVRSAGSRGAGRTMLITAKGFDPKDKAKEPLEFHKDDASLQDFMSEAAGKAGYSMQVQGRLASIQRPYWAAQTESFIHLGHRIASEVGGEFKIKGRTAILYEKNSGQSVSGAALSSVSAVWGVNLLDWDISPVFARPRYETARARWYDIKEAKWKDKTVQIQQQGIAGEGTHTHRRTRADESEASDTAGDDQKSLERGRGAGSVTILGTPSAQPEGTCTVIGARPGIDGSYKIDGVEHTLSRGDGFRTKLDLKHPEGDVGSDSRG